MINVILLLSILFLGATREGEYWYSKMFDYNYFL